MSTIAAIFATPTYLGAVFKPVIGTYRVYSPAHILSDRMLKDIGQHRFREMREAARLLSQRGGRFAN